jgi:cell wall-associated NlpC family hydrolase
MKVRYLVILIAAAFPAPGKPALAQTRAYHSPYRVEFTFPREELVGDLDRTERGDYRLEGEVPFAHWYTRLTQERWRAWGPRARDYPPAHGVEQWPAERKRERVIAVALRFQGYEYQHHHIPDWSPPPDWPWMESCAGANGKGVDCSNLTGFVYNLGFGLRLSTDVHVQAEERVARGPGATRTRLQPVELPSAYQDRLKVLRTGDLVYIRNRRDRISHVITWVGSIGRAPDGTPLVIDSHGDDVPDSAGEPIPCGVQIRPFREHSWYNRSASHALRVFPDSSGAGG